MFYVKLKIISYHVENVHVKFQKLSVANVKRTASYRQALRKSAPPETEELLLTKSAAESDKHVVTSQPTNGKHNDLKDSDIIQSEPMITIEKTNGTNGFKSEQFEQMDSDNQCSQFCCKWCCCQYCKCCPNCCLVRMRRMESLLAQITNSGLNCLRVFT